MGSRGAGEERRGGEGEAPEGLDLMQRMLRKICWSCSCTALTSLPGISSFSQSASDNFRRSVAVACHSSSTTRLMNGCIYSGDRRHAAPAWIKTCLASACEGFGATSASEISLSSSRCRCHSMRTGSLAAPAPASSGCFASGGFRGTWRRPSTTPNPGARNSQQLPRQCKSSREALAAVQQAPSSHCAQASVPSPSTLSLPAPSASRSAARTP